MDNDKNEITEDDVVDSKETIGLIIALLLMTSVFLLLGLSDSKETVAEDPATKASTDFEQQNAWGDEVNTPACRKMCEDIGADFVRYDHSETDPTERCMCVSKEEMSFFWAYELQDKRGRGLRFKWRPKSTPGQ